MLLRVHEAGGCKGTHACLFLDRVKDGVVTRRRDQEGVPGGPHLGWGLLLQTDDRWYTDEPSQERGEGLGAKYSGTT